jgi:hypothetical protein
MYLAGDSFTWGFAPFNDKWGSLIESLTNERVLKCGVSGFGTKQELLKAKKILSSLDNNPELIIVGYNAGNDPWEDYDFLKHSVFDGFMVANTDDSYINLNKEQRQDLFKQQYEWVQRYCMSEEPQNLNIQRIKCLLHKNSIIYNLLKNNVKNLVKSIFGDNFTIKSGLINAIPAKVGVPDNSIFEKHFESIREFKKFADEKGSRLLFVMIPSIEQIYPKMFDESYNPEISDKVKTFLKSQNIDFIDLAPEFMKYSKTNFNWKVDSHWNIAGNHLAGLVVSKFILENDLIEIIDKTKRLIMIDDKIKKEF